MDFFQQLAFSIFYVSSIWSVIIRALIWILISILILIATDNPETKNIKQNTKSYLGFFLMVILVSSSLIFLLFGVTPQ